MTDSELFLTIKNCDNYKTVGDDVQYCILRNPIEKKVYLMFQETRSDYDWKVNLDFPCKPYKHQDKFYLVHRGYAKAWKSCNDIVMKDFITAWELDPKYTPIVCGWSYGGAMSQMAAEDFYYRTKHKPDVITFGSPKILYFYRTKKHFRNSCNEVKQYAQINDFVTWCIPFPFVHFIKKVKCGDKFNLIKLIKETAYNHCNYDKVI